MEKPKPKLDTNLYFNTIFFLLFLNVIHHKNCFKIASKMIKARKYEGNQEKKQKP